jgi:hypothetical protein
MENKHAAEHLKEILDSYKSYERTRNPCSETGFDSKECATLIGQYEDRPFIFSMMRVKSQKRRLILTL